jgi:hypothetical protein
MKAIARSLAATPPAWGEIKRDDGGRLVTHQFRRGWSDRDVRADRR